MIDTNDAAQSNLEFTCRSCGKQIKIPKLYAGRRAKCKHCQVVFTIPDPPSHGGNVELSTGSHGSSVPQPPDSLRSQLTMPNIPVPASGRTSAPNLALGSYESLPWYRKNKVMSWFTIAALLGLCLGIGSIPCLPVCVALATGDIYYDARAADGSLVNWHWANKVAAFILLGVNLLALTWGFRWLRW